MSGLNLKSEVEFVECPQASYQVYKLILWAPKMILPPYFL